MTTPADPYAPHVTMVDYLPALKDNSYAEEGVVVRTEYRIWYRRDGGCLRIWHRDTDVKNLPGIIQHCKEDALATEVGVQVVTIVETRTDIMWEEEK